MLLTAALLLVPAASPRAADLAISGASILDATQEQARRNQVILIEDGRIVRVGDVDEITVPDGTRVIEAREKWVIPGLIDAHVHFFQSGGLFTRPDMIDLRHIRPYAEEIRRIRTTIDSALARYIAAGITGVVDMGGPLWTFDVRERAAGLTWAPRVAVAGPLLGTMAPPEISALDDPPILHIETPEEARRAVEDILGHGPDVLKVWVVSASRLEADLDWVRVVVNMAEDASVPVVAHATERQIAETVVDVGIDILGHGVDDRPIDDGLLAEMLVEDVVYMTTLMVGEGYREVLGADVRLTEIERRLGDPEVIASWSRLPRSLAFATPAVSRAEAENLRRVADRGITVAAGSDAGNIGTLHGPALHREMELMAEVGLMTHQVIAAATLGGAKAMGRADELGTVEEGKIADLVILNADPLQDIRNTRTIHRVIKGGQVLDPALCCE
jgi:imidazolonepropionase-like amidohydrolase